MSTQYSYSTYTDPGPSNGGVGHQLADIFIDLTRRIDGANKICDLGCGNGYLASRLGAAGFQVTGIDASESGLEIAARHYASDRISFVQAEIGGDLTSRLAKDDLFDVVVSSDVIEHLYRPAALIETAVALLKPGGYLIVGTPYHGYLKNLAISIFDKWDDHHTVGWDGGHIKFFSTQTLGSLVVRHGFENLTFHYYGRFPWLWKHMVCIARKAV